MSDLHVVDAHHHVSGPRPLDGDPRPADEDIDARLGVMDALGVAQAILLGDHRYLRPDGIVDTRLVNDALAAYRDRRPDRFPAAIGIVEPLFGDRGFAELQRARDELGLRGITFHTKFQGVAVDSPWVRRYLERMGELGLVPFVHALGEAPSESLWRIAQVAADMPDLTMLVLDVLSTNEQAEHVSRVADAHPNLVFDTGLARGLGYVEMLVTRCGAGRVVYGSDLYASTPRHTASMLPGLRSSDLSDDDKAAVLGGNIRRLLGL